MPNIDLSILNQRQTPAFYADVFANRPAAGFVGRIFISTNTFAFYRDNGTSWDLIGGPGTGTVTGTGANGQVTFWNGASTITGSNDLFWDAVNGHFGIGTNVPGTALDVHHDQPTVAILNQTVATNDVRIGFQNNGVGLWRIGAFYNAGANDFGIYDAVAAIQPVTVKKTTGQVLIGTSTVGSGKLVVASSTGDNGVQIVGASAPSLRIDNAESGPTKRAGLGISTATNNFIQGSADRDFCMFNGSTTASPILFGIYGTTNVQEAARISAARNFLIGTTTDGGYKLSVNGTGYINDRLTIDGTGTGQYIQFYNSGADRAHIYWAESSKTLSLGSYISGGNVKFETDNNVTALIINSSGNLGLGTSPSAWIDYKVLQLGGGSISSYVDNNFIELNQNSFYNGSYRYVNNGFASRYQQNAGRHEWYQAISGSANANITFTQPMTLTAASNLLIGTTTDAGQKLQVAGDVYFNGKADIGLVNILSASTSSSITAACRVRTSVTMIGAEITMQALSPTSGSITIPNMYGYKTNTPTVQPNVTVTNSYGLYISRTDDPVSGGVVTNKYALVTESTAGNVGIGTTTPTSKLSIVGLPTSPVGLNAGDVWNNLGILNIV